MSKMDSIVDLYVLLDDAPEDDREDAREDVLSRVRFDAVGGLVQTKHRAPGGSQR